MTKIESQKLFSNIEEILSIHEILYQDLGKDGREKIGSIFLKMIHYFKIYSVYCANYPTALAFLSSKKVYFFILFFFFHKIRITSIFI